MNWLVSLYSEHVPFDIGDEQVISADDHLHFLHIVWNYALQQKVMGNGMLRGGGLKRPQKNPFPNCHSLRRASRSFRLSKAQ